MGRPPLKAKPEALAARGLPVPESHGTGDVARENAERVAQLSAAQALLAAAARMASEAHTAIRGVAGLTHHATVYAAQAVEACSKADQSARQVLRAIGRTL